VCATGITGCLLNGQSLLLNQCYNPNTFFSNSLTVDWGTAFGQATGSPQNPTNPSLAPWNTSIAGVNVSVGVGTDFSGSGSPSLMRVNNEAFLWNGSAWVNPQFLPTSDPRYATDTYTGQFNAPGPTPSSGDGDHLLMVSGMTNGNFNTGSMVINLSQGVSSAGMLLSVLNTTNNTNFGATIQAFDNHSNLLATYHIDTQGVGGECASLSVQSAPTPCNDAPFIGIQAPGNLSNQLIYQLVISATAPTGGADSLLLDSFEFQEGVTLPEPTVVFLCGTGLVLIGLFRRKLVGAARQ